MSKKETMLWIGNVGLGIGLLYSIYIWVVIYIGITPGINNVYSTWENPNTFFWYGLVGTVFYLIFWICMMIFRKQLIDEKQKENQSKKNQDSIERARYYREIFFKNFYLLKIFFVFFWIYLMIFLTSLGPFAIANYDIILTRPVSQSIILPSMYNNLEIENQLTLNRKNDEYFSNWMALLAIYFVGINILILMSFYVIIIFIFLLDNESLKQGNISINSQVGKINKKKNLI